MKKHKKKPVRDRSAEKVIVVWTDDGKSLRTLATHGGQGAIRVYPKDRVDPRLYLGGTKVPFFATEIDAMLWMGQNRGEQCQVPLNVGKAIFDGFEFEEMYA